MDKTITLTPEEQHVLKELLHDLEMIPGSERLDNNAEDAALWSFIEKVRAL